MIRPAEERATVVTAGREPVPYDDFRTGLTFGDVRELLRIESQQEYRRGQYMWVGRATVLGRLHQLKKEAYQEYLHDWHEFNMTHLGSIPRERRRFDRHDDLEDLPF